jgi:hypothetical protein
MSWQKPSEFTAFCKATHTVDHGCLPVDDEFRVPFAEEEKWTFSPPV